MRFMRRVSCNVLAYVSCREIWWYLRQAHG